MSDTNNTHNGDYRIAPAGFTREQFDEFMRTGMLNIPHALSPDEISYYLDALDRVCAKDERYHDGDFYHRQHLVEWDSAFSDLIDHPRHVGYMYDLFGELLKLHLSDAFIRTGSTNYNFWHPDGARAVPYGVFSPLLPLQVKVGYWLTDLTAPKMGNFVYKPGSHLDQYMDAYDTHETLDDEKVLICKAGTMSIMYCGLWHRVEPNQSDVHRKNIFMAYCPSWVTAADHLRCDPDWSKTLSREQRIIMRDYDHAYDCAKPKPSEFPLYLDRDSRSDRDQGTYHEHVKLNRRKRKTQAEKWLAESPVTA